MTSHRSASLSLICAKISLRCLIVLASTFHLMVPAHAVDRVDFEDLMLFAGAYGAAPGDARYSPMFNFTAEAGRIPRYCTQVIYSGMTAVDSVALQSGPTFTWSPSDSRIYLLGFEVTGGFPSDTMADWITVIICYGELTNYGLKSYIRNNKSILVQNAEQNIIPPWSVALEAPPSSIPFYLCVSQYTWSTFYGSYNVNVTACYYAFSD